MTDETTMLDDAQELAEFGAGFEGKTAEPPAKKPESAETPRTEEAAPEHVQVTVKEWDEIRAAAARTASYDSQFSKLFGTVGNISKLLNEQRAQPSTPAGRKIEIPKDAFLAMERDFPELAQQTRAALEAALSGVHGTGGADVDPAKIETMLASYTSRREVEALEDAYPAWRDIVGAVDITKEQPDPNNAFRKWLSTKDAGYQARVNGTESAAVISRAIRSFQKETTASKPATTPRNDARAERIRSAVQPRGDNAPAPPGKTDDDEFIAGFHSR